MTDEVINPAELEGTDKLLVPGAGDDSWRFLPAEPPEELSLGYTTPEGREQRWIGANWEELARNAVASAEEKDRFIATVKAENRDLREFRDQAGDYRSVKARQQTDDAINKFFELVPDFYESDKNIAVMQQAIMYLRANGRPVTAEALREGYFEAQQGGFIEAKPEPSPAAPAPAPVPMTRRASGISTRARVVPTPQSTQLSEDDMYRLPMDQLRSLANKSLGS